MGCSSSACATLFTTAVGTAIRLAVALWALVLIEAANVFYTIPAMSF